MRDTEREAETQAEGEAEFCSEPDVGLDPRTPGSCPEPKADAHLLNHSGVPAYDLLSNTSYILYFFNKITQTQGMC